MTIKLSILSIIVLANPSRVSYKGNYVEKGLVLMNLDTKSKGLASVTL